MDPKLSDAFIQEYKLTGKKMNIGKSCVRFKKTETLPLGLIAQAISAFTTDAFIEKYKHSRK